MKAALLESVGHPLRIMECPDPQTTADGVVVSVLAVRVPSYTRQVLDGTLPYDLPTPLILGPTCIGRVSEIGAGVFDLKPGEIALCNSLLASGDLVSSEDEILIGWTGSGTHRSKRMQGIWRHGSFAEKALYPARCLTPLPGAEGWEAARLTYLAPIAIAAAGLKRAGIRSGKTVIINGATGQLGSAAILFALARGAGRIVAVGRNQARLDRLAGLSPRVVTYLSSGKRQQDAAALRELCKGGADLVADYLPNTPSAIPTLAAIDALRVGGTAVLVGGAQQELPLSYATIMRRRITIAGSFMFDRETALECWRLVHTGVIDLSCLEVRTFDLDDIEAAIAAAPNMSGFQLSVLQPTK